MKTIYTFLSLIAFLLLGIQSGKAQLVLGPYDKYISVQAGNDMTIANGSFGASADEGRYIDFRIVNISGPIIVDPSEFILNGPPCPTYDSHGNRTPSTPASPTFSTFNGIVKVNPATAPAPGTDASAQFTGRDFGYYTHCALQQKVPYDSQRTVKFNIKSIKLALASHDLCVCVTENKGIKVSSRYPTDQGTVSWASVKGNFSVTGDNNGATLNGLTAGDDLLVATFTVGQVTFKDTAKINVATVAFAKADNYTPHYKNGTFDCNTILDPKSTKKNLRWRITGSGLTGTIDSMTGILKFPANPGGVYPIEVRIAGSKVCVATTKLTLLGFSVILVTNKTYCDGEEAKVRIQPIPATVKVKELACFGTIELYTKTKNKFLGNPIGKEDLEFDDLDANYNSKVKNCYWYSSDLKGDCKNEGCFPYSTHILKAKAKVNGNDVFSVSDPELKISINNPQCITGFTSAVQTFTGAPAFKATVINFQGQQVAVLVVDDEGTLKRDPKGKVTSIGYNKNSQFAKFIQDEEDYHVGQIEGANGTVCADLWLVANVMKNLKALQGPGWLNIAVANQASINSIAAENLRSNNLMVYPQPKRCALEKEAKEATGIKFGYNLKCAYCKCPQK